MIDLSPACEVTAALVADLHGDVLALPTPCDGMDVAGVVAHLDLAGQGFTLIARRANGEPSPPFGPDRGPTWLPDVTASGRRSPSRRRPRRPHPRPR